MRSSILALFAALLLSVGVSGRFLMYYDQWHPSRPDNASVRAGITHIILAFAPANNSKTTWQPSVPVSEVRTEYPGCKVLAAIGGWGELFWAGQVANDAAIQQFAKDVKTMVVDNDLDGVDIDWEYPGGNGIDYKKVPNSAKTGEIPAYPKLLNYTRAAIGNDKILTIAVPGKKVDMIAFTPENTPQIWEPVDYINVMAYDLVNRRDNATGHHTSVEGAKTAVENYLALGAPPDKLNLGFAYYAKYFTTQGDCSAHPLGCPIVPAEDPVTGDDLGTSGAWTYEKANMQPINTAQILASSDGTCGAVAMKKCSGYCCSDAGYCGSTTAYCGGGCQHAFGAGCTGPDVFSSWQRASKGGIIDNVQGGEYFFDPAANLFWTWENAALVKRKFDEIVNAHHLGGVFAWSLGEDSNDWSHVTNMASLVGSMSNAAPIPISSTSGVSPAQKSTPIPAPLPAPIPPKSQPSPPVVGVTGEVIAAPPNVANNDDQGPSVKDDQHSTQGDGDYSVVKDDGTTGEDNYGYGDGYDNWDGYGNDNADDYGGSNSDGQGDNSGPDYGYSNGDEQGDNSGYDYAGDSAGDYEGDNRGDAYQNWEWYRN